MASRVSNAQSSPEQPSRQPINVGKRTPTSITALHLYNSSEQAILDRLAVRLSNSTNPETTLNNLATTKMPASPLTIPRTLLERLNHLNTVVKLLKHNDIPSENINPFIQRFSHIDTSIEDLGNSVTLLNNDRQIPHAEIARFILSFPENPDASNPIKALIQSCYSLRSVDNLKDNLKLAQSSNNNIPSTLINRLDHLNSVVDLLLAGNIAPEKTNYLILKLSNIETTLENLGNSVTLLRSNLIPHEEIVQFILSFPVDRTTASQISTLIQSCYSLKQCEDLLTLSQVLEPVRTTLHKLISNQLPLATKTYIPGAKNTTTIPQTLIDRLDQLNHLVDQLQRNNIPTDQSNRLIQAYLCNPATFGSTIVLLIENKIPPDEIIQFIQFFPKDEARAKQTNRFIGACYNLKSAAALATILEQPTPPNILPTLKARLETLYHLSHMLKTASMSAQQIDELIQNFPLTIDTTYQPRTLETEKIRNIRRFQATISLIQRIELPKSLLYIKTTLNDLNQAITALQAAKISPDHILSLITNFPINNPESSGYYRSIITSIYSGHFKIDFRVALSTIQQTPVSQSNTAENTTKLILKTHIKHLINTTFSQEAKAAIAQNPTFKRILLYAGQLKKDTNIAAIDLHLFTLILDCDKPQETTQNIELYTQNIISFYHTLIPLIQKNLSKLAPLMHPKNGDHELEPLYEEDPSLEDLIVPCINQIKLQLPSPTSDISTVSTEIIRLALGPYTSKWGQFADVFC